MTHKRLKYQRIKLLGQRNESFTMVFQVFSSNCKCTHTQNDNNVGANIMPQIHILISSYFKEDIKWLIHFAERLVLWGRGCECVITHN